jgi:uncharacterized protein YaiL (DUF2058 family)
MANLRDQLLKAGLIDKKAKHLAEQEERARAKAAKADKSVAIEAQKADQEKARRYEQELAARRQADREREVAHQAQIREIERMHRLESVIDRNEVKQREGRRRFYFRSGATRVGFLDVQERQGRALEEGDLCVVRDPGDTAKPFKLMDVDGLAELRSIDESALVFHAPLWKPLYSLRENGGTRPEPGSVPGGHGPETAHGASDLAAGSVPAAEPEPSSPAGTEPPADGRTSPSDIPSADRSADAHAASIEIGANEPWGAELAAPPDQAEGPSSISGIDSGTSTSM